MPHEFPNPEGPESANFTNNIERCTRSPTFWYDDGNVVLQSDQTLFRVHRGVLASHSAIFSDTFAMQQPEDVPLYDGCPVVLLSGDSPEEWDTLLSSIYRPQNVHPWLPGISVDKLFCLLYLARKYDMEDLTAACTERLHAEFPTELSEYDKVYAIAPTTEPEDSLSPEQAPKLLPSLTHRKDALITLINNVVDLDIQTILPTAYYVVVTNFNSTEITEGVLALDGSLKALNKDSQSAIIQGLAQLYPRMMRAMTRYTDEPTTEVEQWTRACQEVREFEEEVVGPSAASANPWPDCDAAFKRARRKAMQNASTHPRAKEFALASCRPGEEFGDMFDGMCDMCRKRELRARERERRLFWSRLPEMFGVGPVWPFSLKC